MFNFKQKIKHQLSSADFFLERQWKVFLFFLGTKWNLFLVKLMHLGLIFQYLSKADWPSAIIHYFQQTPMYIYPVNFPILYQLHHFLAMLSRPKKLITKDIYEWEVDGKKIAATLSQFLCLNLEYFNGEYEKHYQGEWKDKRVIDLGGFVGDSALFFLTKGASRVIVYEPVPKNIEVMKINLKQFYDKTEIYERGIAQASEPFKIFSNSPPETLGFGLAGVNYSIESNGITFRDVLKQHSADIIKVDIEGAEEFLLDAPSELIKTIPYWIVETHSAALGEKIPELFKKTGFSITKKFNIAEHVDLFHFVRHDDF